MPSTLRRALTLLAFASAAGWPLLAQAQLPPPDRLLTEPRASVLQIGPMDVHLRAVTTAVYDDNVYWNRRGRPFGLDPGDEFSRDDFIFAFAPGVVLQKAATLQDSRTALSLDYSPAFVFFMENERENSVDHTAKLQAGYALTRLTFGLVQDFSSTAGGVVDVGHRVQQQSFRTAANARYELSQKTFLQLDGTFRILDYEELRDSREWTVVPTANYQITPKVTVGLGVTVGELEVIEERRFLSVSTNSIPFRTNLLSRMESETQRYTGPTLRASYRTTEKTDVALSLGGEWRFYDDGETAFGPVFGLTASYRPTQGTVLTLEGHRREQNSAVQSGVNYIMTGFSVGVRQRLHDRLFGHLRFAYDNSDYKTTRRGVNTQRQDDYFLLRYGLDTILGRRWSIGLFHQYREVISSEETYSFDNNQVGIQASWVY